MTQEVQNKVREYVLARYRQTFTPDSTMIIKEHDATTGEIIEREMTAAEITQWEADNAEAETIKAAEATKAAEKAAVLAKLGLTANEVAALLS